jgi:hypothetical protein
MLTKEQKELTVKLVKLVENLSPNSITGAIKEGKRHDNGQPITALDLMAVITLSHSQAKQQLRKLQEAEKVLYNLINEINTLFKGWGLCTSCGGMKGTIRKDIWSDCQICDGFGLVKESQAAELGSKFKPIFSGKVGEA